MIWLVWRRYRALMLLTFLVLAGLALWMVLLGRAFEGAESSNACSLGLNCDIFSGTLSLSNQATAINVLLLAAPCVLGVVFGAPLVAGELERATNRVAWTQGVSRTRWLLVKWLLVALGLVAVIAALTVLSQWWTGHIVERLDFINIGLETGTGRIQPLYFPTTGLALSAYTLFAFSLGAALGALVRRTSWAIVGTVVLYTVVAVVAVLFVRPVLAPQLFVPIPSEQQGQQVVSGTLTREAVASWNLGFGYRYAPGSRMVGPSADVVAQRCENPVSPAQPDYFTCLAHHHIEMGTTYQPQRNYWQLQWKESTLLVIFSAALLAATVWSVRRWTA